MSSPGSKGFKIGSSYFVFAFCCTKVFHWSKNEVVFYQFPSVGLKILTTEGINAPLHLHLEKMVNTSNVFKIGSMYLEVLLLFFMKLCYGSKNKCQSQLEECRVSRTLKMRHATKVSLSVDDNIYSPTPCRLHNLVGNSVNLHIS